jgi:phage terminase large subunit-like protein
LQLMSDLSKEFLSSLAEAKLEDDFDMQEGTPPTYPVNGDAKSMARLLTLIEQYQKRRAEAGSAKWFDPDGPYPIDVCPKHKAFFSAGSIYDERLFMAANRVGKTICGAFESTCHATGIYPMWWAGRVFDHPTDGWVVGPDARTVRDTVQKELLGPIGEWGTGMIPAHLLGKWSALQGTPAAIDVIRIKHISGGWSTIGFKNYKQDIQAFMGTSRHWVWTDEECPIEIWNECNIRTATTDGIMYATFTPLQGLTRMVVNFCKQADFLVGARPIIALEAQDFEEDWDEENANEAVGSFKSKCVIQAGWDDAPWLTETVKKRLLEDTPEHLKDSRSKGIPSMGAGAVFPIPIEQVLCDPFPIPDNWPRMYGLDVGWNRTAAVWGALDPNSDTLYLYDEHYQGEQMPQHHAFCIKSRWDWIIGVIHPSTRGRSHVDGARQLQINKSNG